MKTKIIITSVFLFVILAFSNTVFSATPTLIVDSSSSGWTGKISFHSSSDVDLATYPILFEVSNNVKVSSVWGIDGNSILSQSGNLISVKVYSWWPENQGMILKAGVVKTLSFSASDLNYKISNIRFGGTSQQEGSIILSKAAASLDIPAGSIIKLISQSDKSIIKSFNFENNKSFSVPYGTYDISGSAVVGGINVSLTCYPAIVKIDSSNSATISITYSSNLKDIAFSFAQSNPENISSLPINIKDLADNSSINISIPWGNSVKTITAVKGHQYLFSIANITTSQYIYKFSFTPSSVLIGDANTYNFSISYIKEQVPAGDVYVSINGLPSNSFTSLNFTPSDALNQKVTINSVGNGKNSVSYKVNVGDYTLSAASILVGDLLYSVANQGIKIAQGDNTFTLNFTSAKQSAVVRGWPSFISMGAVTDSNYTNKETFKNRPLDAIFKYAGDGGNGDLGKIVYPIYTINTIKQADDLSISFAKKVVPVMVVYTSEMSGGTSFKDFEDGNNELTMHYINLMLESSVMESYKSLSNPYPGSIVLNPDLLGMVEQQNLWNSAGTGELNKKIIDVNKAIQKANWFMITKHNWNLQLTSGVIISVLGKTPVELISYIDSGALKDKGVYSPWDVKSTWETEAKSILMKAPVNLNAVLPNFENNFKGWIQATNWAVKTFAPDITFGWQSNVWSVGSSNWVHKDLSQQQIIDSYATPVSKLWNDLGVYNGTYRPDFIVFDKYEMDATAAAGIGYLWNQRDLNNYLGFVKAISDKIGNIPVMLWQIPGGHLQKISGDIDNRGNHGSTESIYFLGDSELKADLSNVQSYILNISLPVDLYGTTSVKTYLIQNGQDWTKSHMSLAKDSRVFSILWGGGQTTSIGTVGSDDKGWLAGKVIEYYKNPTYLEAQDPAELVAKDDSVSTDLNKTVEISVLSNDVGSNLKLVRIAASPSHGMAIVSGSKISYTPNNGYIGNDKFSYVVSNDKGKEATAFVDVIVNNLVLPIVNNDAVETLKNIPITIDVLANDTPSGLTLIGIIQPSNGIAAINNGKVIYTPNSGFVGNDSFSYTVNDAANQQATGKVAIVVKENQSNNSSVQFKVTSEWATGFNADIIITNKTGLAFSSWVLEFDFNHNITSLWNGVISSHVGNHYVVKDAGWNGVIQPNGSVTIGLGGSSNGSVSVPYNIFLNGVAVDNGGGGQDLKSPSLDFLSLYDGQIIKMKSLSPIKIDISATDESGIASTEISVDGKLYDTMSVSWIPSAFGSYKIIATAKDKNGNISSKNINITIVLDQDINSAKKQIIGYLPQWDAWKSSNYQLPAQGVFNHLNVNYSKYTILNFSFFGVANDGSLHSADYRNKNKDADQQPAPILNEDLYSSWDMWILYGDLKYNYNTNPPTIEKVTNGAPGLFDLAKANNVKLMASIGGWSMSKHFSAMAADPQKKAKFLADCKKLINMGFDGIDIDWEYPGPFEGMNFTGNQSDYKNFADLMRDIRTEIGAGKLLTAAFSSSQEKLNGFDFNVLNQYMDYYNIMTYDMEGGWSNNAGHNSALYSDGNAPSWDVTFKYLINQKGAKAEKINMGAAFYGRGVKTVGNATLGGQTSKSSQTFQIDGTVYSAADQTNWGLFEGAPYYYYIKNNTSAWTKLWDDKGKVPYMVKDNFFLSYDNTLSMQHKADYIKQNNIGGVIVWEVFGDMEFSGGVSYYSGNKLPKAGNVSSELLDVLHNALNK